VHRGAPLLAIAAGLIGKAVIVAGTVPAGRRVSSDRSPFLDPARVFPVEAGSPPLPDSLWAGAAAASGGTSDARLVHVGNGTILDTGTVTGRFQVGIDDGSGRLVMQVETLVSVLTGPFVPGAQVDATGGLAATGSGSWQLWPREAGDYFIH
jgi:hypothetical protein